MDNAVNNHKSYCVAILDAGSQYGKVIDRRIRELKFQTIFFPLSVTPEVLREENAKCIIISGGPSSVYASNAPLFRPEVLNMGIPVLGICYGMQLMLHIDGAKVQSLEVREDGECSISIDNDCVLFHGLDKIQTVLLTHGDSCVTSSPNFRVIGNSGSLIAAVAHKTKSLYGLQFHPEVDLTVHGREVLSNFLYRISNLEPNFTLTSRVSDCIEEIRSQVGNKHVLCLVSGGVDSTVCAALLHRAIGKERVKAVHINNGFMRKDESNQVLKSLKAIGLDNVFYSDSSLLFYSGSTDITCISHEQKIIRRSKFLNSVILPEEKRKIIGDVFVKCTDSIIARLNLNPEATLYAQGTLRPDLIESSSSYASSQSDAIKTHHNDSELVRKLRDQGKVIEPLKDFHKDEVREIGRELNIDTNLVERHPFPGPGLAIRIICAEEPFIDYTFHETITLLRHIVTYSCSRNRPYTLLNRVRNCLTPEEDSYLSAVTATYQLTSVLLPIRTVGVQGDSRTYSYCATISSNESPDWKVLFFLAKIIPRCCHNINRVTYAFGPAIQVPVQDVTPTYLSVPAIEVLREADFIANQILIASGCYKQLSQLAIVMIPIHFHRDPLFREPSCKRSIVIRTFITRDFMTGVPVYPDKDMPFSVLQKMADSINKIPGISRVLFDLTSKPPGTTEWE